MNAPASPRHSGLMFQRASSGRLRNKLLDQHQAEDGQRQAVEEREARGVADCGQPKRGRDLRKHANRRRERRPPPRANSCVAVLQSTDAG